MTPKSVYGTPKSVYSTPKSQFGTPATLKKEQQHHSSMHIVDLTTPIKLVAASPMPKSLLKKSATKLTPRTLTALGGSNSTANDATTSVECIDSSPEVIKVSAAGDSTNKCTGATSAQLKMNTPRRTPQTLRQRVLLNSAQKTCSTANAKYKRISLGTPPRRPVGLTSSTPGEISTSTPKNNLTTKTQFMPSTSKASSASISLHSIRKSTGHVGKNRPAVGLSRSLVYVKSQQILTKACKTLIASPHRQRLSAIAKPLSNFVKTVPVKSHMSFNVTFSPVREDCENEATLNSTFSISKDEAQAKGDEPIVQAQGEESNIESESKSPLVNVRKTEDLLKEIDEILNKSDEMERKRAAQIINKENTHENESDEQIPKLTAEKEGTKTPLKSPTTNPLLTHNNNKGEWVLEDTNRPLPVRRASMTVENEIKTSSHTPLKRKSLFEGIGHHSTRRLLRRKSVGGFETELRETDKTDQASAQEMSKETSATENDEVAIVVNEMDDLLEEIEEKVSENDDEFVPETQVVQLAENPNYDCFLKSPRAKNLMVSTRQSDILDKTDDEMNVSETSNRKTDDKQEENDESNLSILTPTPKVPKVERISSTNPVFSPFTASDVISDLPRNDIEVWVSSLENKKSEDIPDANDDSVEILEEINLKSSTPTILEDETKSDISGIMPLDKSDESGLMEQLRLSDDSDAEDTECDEIVEEVIPETQVPDILEYEKSISSDIENKVKLDSEYSHIIAEEDHKVEDNEEILSTSDNENDEQFNVLEEKVLDKSSSFEIENEIQLAPETNDIIFEDDDDERKNNLTILSPSVIVNEKELLILEEESNNPDNIPDESASSDIEKEDKLDSETTQIIQDEVQKVENNQEILSISDNENADQFDVLEEKVPDKSNSSDVEPEDKLDPENTQIENEIAVSDIEKEEEFNPDTLSCSNNENNEQLNVLEEKILDKSSTSDIETDRTTHVIQEEVNKVENNQEIVSISNNENDKQIDVLEEKIPDKSSSSDVGDEDKLDPETNDIMLKYDDSKEDNDQDMQISSDNENDEKFYVLEEKTSNASNNSDIENNEESNTDEEVIPETQVLGILENEKLCVLEENIPNKCISCDVDDENKLDAGTNDVMPKDDDSKEDNHHDKQDSSDNEIAEQFDVLDEKIADKSSHPDVVHEDKLDAENTHTISDIENKDKLNPDTLSCSDNENAEQFDVLDEKIPNISSSSDIENEVQLAPETTHIVQEKVGWLENNQELVIISDNEDDEPFNVIEEKIPDKSSSADVENENIVDPQANEMMLINEESNVDNNQDILSISDNENNEKLNASEEKIFDKSSRADVGNETSISDIEKEDKLDGETVETMSKEELKDDSTMLYTSFTVNEKEIENDDKLTVVEKKADNKGESDWKIDGNLSLRVEKLSVDHIGNDLQTEAENDPKSEEQEGKAGENLEIAKSQMVEIIDENSLDEISNMIEYEENVSISNSTESNESVSRSIKRNEKTQKNVEESEKEDEELLEKPQSAEEVEGYDKVENMENVDVEPQSEKTNHENDNENLASLTNDDAGHPTIIEKNTLSGKLEIEGEHADDKKLKDENNGKTYTSIEKNHIKNKKVKFDKEFDKLNSPDLIISSPTPPILMSSEENNMAAAVTHNESFNDSSVKCENSSSLEDHKETKVMPMNFDITIKVNALEKSEDSTVDEGVVKENTQMEEKAAVEENVVIENIPLAKEQSPIELKEANKKSKTAGRKRNPSENETDIVSKKPARGKESEESAPASPAATTSTRSTRVAKRSQSVEMSVDMEIKEKRPRRGKNAKELDVIDETAVTSTNEVTTAEVASTSASVGRGRRRGRKPLVTDSPLPQKAMQAVMMAASLTASTPSNKGKSPADISVNISAVSYNSKSQLRASSRNPRAVKELTQAEVNTPSTRTRRGRKANETTETAPPATSSSDNLSIEHASTAVETVGRRRRAAKPNVTTETAPPATSSSDNLSIEHASTVVETVGRTRRAAKPIVTMENVSMRSTRARVAETVEKELKKVAEPVVKTSKPTTKKAKTAHELLEPEEELEEVHGEETKKPRNRRGKAEEKEKPEEKAKHNDEDENAKPPMKRRGRPPTVKSVEEPIEAEASTAEEKNTKTRGRRGATKASTPLVVKESVHVVASSDSEAKEQNPVVETKTTKPKRAPAKKQKAEVPLEVPEEEVQIPVEPKVKAKRAPVKKQKTEVQVTEPAEVVEEEVQIPVEPKGKAKRAPVKKQKAEVQVEEPAEVAVEVEMPVEPKPKAKRGRKAAAPKTVVTESVEVLVSPPKKRATRARK